MSTGHIITWNSKNCSPINHRHQCSQARRINSAVFITKDTQMKYIYLSFPFVLEQKNGGSCSIDWAVLLSQKPHQYCLPDPNLSYSSLLFHIPNCQWTSLAFLHEAPANPPILVSTLKSIWWSKERKVKPLTLSLPGLLFITMHSGYKLYKLKGSSQNILSQVASQNHIYVCSVESEPRTVYNQHPNTSHKVLKTQEVLHYEVRKCRVTKGFFYT